MQLELTAEQNAIIAARFPDDPASAIRAQSAVVEILSKLRAAGDPSDDDILQTFSDACEYADRCGQGFSYGRAQALRAVISHYAVPQASTDYQSAVEESLAVRHLGVASGDARADLKRVLDWDVAVALDPAVSSDAQALIDKGRNEAAERFQRNLKDPNVVHVNMLRGTIAPITFDQLAHILGDEATAEWIADRQQRKESNHAPRT